MEIYERIKEIRKENNLTQEEFGNRLGVGKYAITNIELGRVEPKSSLIKLIASEFDLNEEWILAGIGEKHPARTTDQQLARRIGQTIGADDEFRKNLILTLLELEDDDWEVIKKLYNEMQKKMGK
jgi:transcriptional regulator with XRE-family HTH domain